MNGLDSSRLISAGLKRAVNTTPAELKSFFLGLCRPETCWWQGFFYWNTPWHSLMQSCFPQRFIELGLAKWLPQQSQNLFLSLVRNLLAMFLQCIDSRRILTSLSQCSKTSFLYDINESLLIIWKGIHKFVTSLFRLMCSWRFKRSPVKSPDQQTLATSRKLAMHVSANNRAQTFVAAEAPRPSPQLAIWMIPCRTQCFEWLIKSRSHSKCRLPRNSKKVPLQLNHSLDPSTTAL